MGGKTKRRHGRQKRKKTKKKTKSTGRGASLAVARTRSLCRARIWRYTGDHYSPGADDSGTQACSLTPSVHCWIVSFSDFYSRGALSPKPGIRQQTPLRSLRQGPSDPGSRTSPPGRPSPAHSRTAATVSVASHTCILLASPNAPTIPSCPGRPHPCPAPCPTRTGPSSPSPSRYLPWSSLDHTSLSESESGHPIWSLASLVSAFTHPSLPTFKPNPKTTHLVGSRATQSVN